MLSSIAGMRCRPVRPLIPAVAGGPIQNVPAGANYSSPFSSLDLRLKKDFRLGEHESLSLIGEGFNMFNETNIRGSSNTNYAGRSIAISLTRQHRTGNPHRRCRPTSMRL